MKNLLVVVLGVSLSVLCLQSVSAWPSPEELENVQAAFDAAVETTVEPEEEADVQSELPEITARITCDLLSGWVWGERLCAAHCIAKGYRGGWCDNRKVCNCRR